MKVIAIVLFILLKSVVILQSQTYVEPIIGFGITKTEVAEIDSYEDFHVISDEKFDNNYLIVGFGVSQRLLRNLSLDMRYTNSRLRFACYDRGFAGWDKYRIKRHELSLIPNLVLSKRLEIGAGVNFKRLYGIDIGHSYREIWNKMGKGSEQNQVGGIFSIRYIYKLLSRSFVYSNVRSTKLKIFNNIESTNSIELCLGYRIKVLNKLQIGGKRSECPKF